MDLPKRTKQKRSEATSYAILLYKLRDLGVFRNVTDNDYGIDFELELVKDEQVTGKTVKIQVKSAEDLRLRKDKTPTVGGIKQTTLAYWCELSFRTNVIAYAVDLKTETIYVSRNLFWHATQEIDGGEASKSIEFIAAGKDGDQTAKLATVLNALAPTAADEVYAHTLAIRRWKSFVGLLADSFHYDLGSELHEPEVFHDLLEAARILLWATGGSLWTDPKDQKYWPSYDYWVQKSEAEGWGGLSYFAARPVLSVLVPAMLRSLRTYRDRVLAGKYYWANRNPQYLVLVYENPLTDIEGPQELIDWHYESRHAASPLMASTTFLLEARKPATPKSRKPRKAKSTKTLKAK